MELNTIVMAVIGFLLFIFILLQWYLSATKIKNGSETGNQIVQALYTPAKRVTDQQALPTKTWRNAYYGQSNEE